MLAKTIASFFASALILPNVAQSTDYVARLTEAGTRDYYCTTTIEIENRSENPLTAVNAFVDLVGAEGPIATSRGVFAGPIPPGESLAMTMDAPNEPCQEIESYVLVIGNCQIERSFLDVGECVAAFDVEAPVTGVRAR